MSKPGRSAKGFAAAKPPARGPAEHDARLNQVVALIHQGTLHEAETICRELIAAGVINHRVYGNLATICRMMGRLDEAIACAQKALELQPDCADTHHDLGLALQDKGHLSAAVDCYQKAIERRPVLPEAYLNLGNALQEQGDLVAAIAAYNKALELRPDFPDARANLATAQLASGNDRQGWQGYDDRFRIRTGGGILIASPACLPWRGEAITRDSRLMLVCEQGLGDTLQFMRYALALKRRGVRVSLCAQPKLHSLIQASGIDPVPLTPAQASEIREGSWIPLLSVPRLLDVSPARPIITEPYIKPTDQRIEAWKTILSAEQRPIIGINWQGDPSHEKTASVGRSVPLESFMPIASRTQARLLSLQKGAGSEQLDTCSFRDRFVACQDRINDTGDFLETAAIIANCDLVITSDTSVAHLAGGMGKTTWLLLKKVPEWRWGLEGETTFWYPSMRLFRQKQSGNWDELMERVAQELIRAGFCREAEPSPAPQAGEVPEASDPRRPTVRRVGLAEIKIFCISLKDAAVRRQSIEEMKARFGLDLEFIDAVDGRHRTREEIQALTDRKIRWNGLNGHRDEISRPTEAACCLSHIHAWETIVGEGLEQAIILEDDVFLGAMTDLIMPMDAEFMYLSSRAGRNARGEAAAPLCGAEAYYLTNQCARKLLEINREILMPVDIQWLPQIESLIASGHFLTAFTNKASPTFKAFSSPGVFRLSRHHLNSQIRPVPSEKKVVSRRFLVPISLGDLIDKITILQVKARHVQGPVLENVRTELDVLDAIRNRLRLSVEPALIERLRQVNQDLWDIEAAIRLQERQQNFGETFIRLARSFHQQNDRRAAIMAEINATDGSACVDERSDQP